MIDEVNKIELTDAERQAFKKLGTLPEFKVVVGAMEKYILRLDAGFLTGRETEEGASGKEFYKLRAFLYFWGKFKSTVEDKDQKNT